MKAQWVGVDGCRSGWITAAISAAGEVEVRRFSTIAEAWAVYDEAELWMVDMPMGLRSGGSEERSCDKLARQLLRPRRMSSVFPVPVRDVLESRDYEQALARSRELTGKGISKQVWYLIPKIREVDTLLRSDERARQLMKEAHPEVCAAMLFGAPMVHPKRTDAGYEERIAWLSAVWPQASAVVVQAWTRMKRKEAARDDLVDAMLLAASGFAGRNRLYSLPEEPEVDDCGLGMAIWYGRLG